jgi:two-component system nitrogen regulation sensor histidine kinase NtrY
VGWMPPMEAYVRAVRGWREPLVVGSGPDEVFTPLPGRQEPTVVAVLGLHFAASGGGPSPGEWFAVMGLLASILAIAAAEAMGRRLADPLARLVSAARQLEMGEPVPGVVADGDEDVAALSRAFRTMADTVQRREEELRRGRDLLERVLRTLSAAVIVAGEGGRVELANPAGRALAPAGATIAGLGAAFDPVVPRLAERAALGEVAEATVHPRSFPDRLWRVTVQPLSGASGRVLFVMEDLSEVARAQRLATVAEAARIVAHEVKNPLTPIRLWAEELQAALDRGPERVVAVARVAAEQILDRAEQLRQVAQGFSNLVALEQWHVERVPLAAVAGEVASEYTVLAERGVVVAVEAHDPGEVLADPTWLRRVLRNLLENSTRAIGAHTGRVDIAVAREGADVVITVRDTGGGVPEDDLARMFEPHFSTTSEGSGLGLAIVQRVVARAGGRVRADNGRDGLEVTIVLPAAV